MDTHIKLKITSVILLSALLLSSCGNPAKTGNTVIGNLKKDGVEVSVPNGAVAVPGALQIETTDKAPGTDASDGKLIGIPYNMEIDGDVKRFDEPVTVTFQINDQQWQALQSPLDLQIAYYDGYTWDYLDPSSIDAEQKTLSFITYHCSFLSPAEPTPEKIMKQVAHEKALEDYNLTHNSELRKTTESLVKNIMGDKVDKSLLQDIVEGMMDQNDFTQMLKAGANANAEEFQNQFIATYTQVTASTLWAYSATFADNLGDLGSNLGLVGAFGSSAAMIADGDYQQAAEELARGIIETNPLGKLLSTAVKVTNRQIARWKNEELEAAYKIYLNGKEPTIPFWGYGQIEAGNFDELWDQMRGIGRQIIIDAVSDFKEEKGREPTDSERKQLEEDAKKTLKAEFDNRKNKEAAIAEAEAKNLEFMEILKNGNLLTRDRYGYDSNKMSYKQRVNQLLSARNRVLSDTGRKLSFTGQEEDGWIDAYTVSELISVYVRDGDSAYQQALIDKGLVEGFDLSKAAGSYTGTLVFLQNDISSSTEDSQNLTPKVDGKTNKDMGELNVETTVSTDVHISNAEITLNLGADGRISLSYTVHSSGTETLVEKRTYPNGEELKTTTTDTCGFSVAESFKNLAIKTTPGSVTELKHVTGNRYVNGSEASQVRGTKYVDDGSQDREFSHNNEYTTAVLKSLTVKIDGNKLILTGKLDFNHPGNLISVKPAAASFTIEIVSS